MYLYGEKNYIWDHEIYWTRSVGVCIYYSKILNTGNEFFLR